MKAAEFRYWRYETDGAVVARRISLINQVAPPGQLMAHARALAQTILECAPLAVQASKQVMLQSAGQPDLQAAIQASYAAAERMLASADVIEGPRAFAEKRKPRWTGR